MPRRGALGAHVTHTRARAHTHTHTNTTICIDPNTLTHKGQITLESKTSCDEWTGESNQLLQLEEDGVSGSGRHLKFYI